MTTQYTISLSVHSPEESKLLTLVSTAHGRDLYGEVFDLVENKTISGFWAIARREEANFYFNTAADVETYLQILKADARIFSIIQTLK